MNPELKPYKFHNFLFDSIMFCLTGSFWLVWVAIRTYNRYRKVHK